MARNPLRFNQSIPNLRPNLRASDAAFAGAGAKEAALARGAQDMANAALFMASDESEFMNGAVLVIDAGKETLSDRAAKFYPID